MPCGSKDLTQPIYMEKNRGRRRYARIKPENVVHARRKGIRTTTVDLAEILRSGVSGYLSAKSSKQVNLRLRKVRTRHITFAELPVCLQESELSKLPNQT